MMPFGIELTPQDAIALVTTAIGAGTDLATRKIYNWLTFPTMAIGIGVVFGVYPASRAARLAPIDALRSE
mgnify:CR=1 FL=1